MEERAPSLRAHREREVGGLDQRRSGQRLIESAGGEERRPVDDEARRRWARHVTKKRPERIDGDAAATERDELTVASGEITGEITAPSVRPLTAQPLPPIGPRSHERIEPVGIDQRLSHHHEVFPARSRGRELTAARTVSSTVLRISCRIRVCLASRAHARSFQSDAPGSTTRDRGDRFGSHWRTPSAPHQPARGPPARDTASSSIARSVESRREDAHFADEIRVLALDTSSRFAAVA
jgi:hypothetical protein